MSHNTPEVTLEQRHLSKSPNWKYEHFKWKGESAFPSHSYICLARPLWQGSAGVRAFMRKLLAGGSSPVVFISVKKGHISCLNGVHLEGQGTAIGNINITIPLTNTLNPRARIMEGINKSEINMQLSFCGTSVIPSFHCHLGCETSRKKVQTIHLGFGRQHLQLFLFTH